MNHIFSKSIEINKNISFIDECKQITINKYSELELSVIKNNKEFVTEYLKNGRTLFQKNKLCRNYSEHIACSDKCYKNALYLAFINYCRGYKTVYSVIKKIVKIMPQYRQHCTCCDYDMHDNLCLSYDLISKLFNFYKNLECVCSVINSSSIIYKEDFLNFIKISTYFTKNIDKIFYKETSSFDKLILTQQKECLHVNNENINDIFCKKKDNMGDFDKYLFNQLKKSFLFLDNCSGIIGLLINQQFIESFPYLLENHTTSDIFDYINEIVKKSSILDINCKNMHNDLYMSDILSQKCNDSKIFEEMLSNNLNLSLSKNNLLQTAITFGNYNIIPILVDKIDFIEENFILELIISKKIRIDKKIYLMKKLAKKNVYLTQTHFCEIIKMKDPIEMLNIVNDKNFIIDDVILIQSIQTCNIELLDNILSKYKICVEINPYKYILNNFSILKLKMLFPLSKVFSLDNDLTMFDAIKNNNVEFVEELIKCHCNYLIMDNNETILTLSIKYEYYDLIDVIIRLCDRDLLNKKNNINYPIFLAIKNEEIFNSIIKSNKIYYDLDSDMTLFQTILHQNTFSPTYMKKITKKLLKQIDPTKITHTHKEPPIILAIINNNYVSAKLIFDYFIKNEYVTLMYDNQYISNINDIAHLNVTNIHISTKSDINYFPIVLDYLIKSCNKYYNKDSDHDDYCLYYDEKEFLYFIISIIWICMTTYIHKINILTPDNNNSNNDLGDNIDNNSDKFEELCNNEQKQNSDNYVFIKKKNITPENEILSETKNTNNEESKLLFSEQSHYDLENFFN
jgi:hypothetical protein